MQILAMSSVVWISEWRSKTEPDNASLPAGSDAEWVALAEGPLFVCSRDTAPYHVIIIKCRSQHSGTVPHLHTCYQCDCCLLHRPMGPVDSQRKLPPFPFLLMQMQVWSSTRYLMPSNSPSSPQ
jgi:hypothetical protein